MPLTKSISIRAGNKRNALFLLKVIKSNLSYFNISFVIKEDIKNPLRTKNISTPIIPPPNEEDMRVQPKPLTLQ